MTVSVYGKFHDNFGKYVNIDYNAVALMNSEFIVYGSIFNNEGVDK